MKILKYLISLLTLCVWLSSALIAQQIRVEVDTTGRKRDFKPTGLRIGTDAISIVSSFGKDDIKRYEFLADIDFNRYFFNVAYGHSERTLTHESGVYTVEGNYFRIGPDINFLKKDPERNALFFGLRYSFNTFSDQLTYSVNDPVFGNNEAVISNNNLHAHWLEAVTGMKVKIGGGVWLGYTARLKFGVNTFERNDLIPTQIPGYGRADSNVNWGFHYWVTFRIPFRKIPGPLVIEVR